MIRNFPITLGMLLALNTTAVGLDGEFRIHDPSSLVRCGGKFYTYGTGGTCLTSDDGWTWSRGAAPPRRGMAPDVVQVGDRYLLYVARNVGAQPRADINLIWTKSLDMHSPEYAWEEAGVVASSDGIEDCNAIDPGLLLDPADGKLWMVFGSYFGFIRLVELDAKTGLRTDTAGAPVNLAVNCEAAVLIREAGWYYLLATHGSCCRGTESGYNIRVGRSRKITGPYLDHEGVDMIRGGGKLFVGSGGRVIGPGHFGRIPLGEGMEKFSCHYEADLDRGGASVLDIRPLLWKDGWPIAGDNLRDGTYQIESVRTGTVLELAVEGMPVGGRRERRCAWPTTCVRRNKGGTSPPRPTPAVTSVRPSSGLRWPIRIERLRPPPKANWRSCPRSRGRPNSFGGSINLPTGAGASNPSRPRVAVNLPRSRP